MAETNLKIRAMLDATGVKRGFGDLKKNIASVHKEVVAPLGQSLKALTSLFKKAAVAGSVLAGIGVKNAFGDEQIVSQFQTLGNSLEEAKQKYQSIVDMSMSGDAVAIDSDKWSAAALAMERLGAAALVSQDALRAIGGSALRSGNDITQVARMVADFYAKVATGRDVGETTAQFLRSGIISQEGLQRVQAAGRSIDAVNVLLAEMQRNTAALSIASNTGLGQLTRLKTVMGQSFGAVFSGFAENFKDVIFQVSNSLTSLYRDGTLTKWGNAIAEATKSVLNSIQGLISGWKNLSDENKDKIKTMLIWGSALVAGFRSGVLGPLLQMLAGTTQIVGALLKNIFLSFQSCGIGVVATWAKVMAMLGGVLLAGAGVIIGYKIGKAIADSLNPSGWFMSYLTKKQLEAQFRELREMAANRAVAGEITWDEYRRQVQLIKKNRQAAFAEFGNVMSSAQAEWVNKNNNAGFMEIFIPKVKENFSELATSLKDAFGISAISELFGDVFKENFAEMPRLDVKTMPEMLNTAGAIADLKTINKMRRGDFNLRGSYAGGFGTKNLSQSVFSALNVESSRESKSQERSAAALLSEQREANGFLKTIAENSSRPVTAGVASATWGE